jgi:hypothetical protein
MASPEAKILMRQEAIRGFEYVSEQMSSTQEKKDFFLEQANQPTYGDLELRDIFVLQAALELFAEAAGVDLEEVDLSEEAQIGEYRESDKKSHITSDEEPSYPKDGPDNPSGQLLDEEPKAADEADEVSDEDYEESLSESDLSVQQANEEAAEKEEEEAEEAEAEEAEEDGESESSRHRGSR